MPAPNNMLWVQPVNGPLGLDAIPGTTLTYGSSIGSSIVRFEGVGGKLIPGTGLGANVVYAPPEQYSNTMVYVRETAIEFNADFGIDMLAMSEC